MDEANIPPAMGSDAPPPLVPALPPEPERNKILFGPNGLRAGWRLLIFLLILGGIVGALLLAAHYAAIDRKSTRLNSSHQHRSRMPSSA